MVSGRHDLLTFEGLKLLEIDVHAGDQGGGRRKTGFAGWLCGLRGQLLGLFHLVWHIDHFGVFLFDDLQMQSSQRGF